MAIKMNQSLKQQQSLMMSPQLQQAIKLLTLTHLEMTNMISQEMVENPMLEEMGNDLSSEEPPKDVDYDIEKLDQQNKEATSEQFSEQQAVQGKDDFDWNNYLESFENRPAESFSGSKNDSEEMPNYENIVSKGMSLYEHLEWQLRMESLLSTEWEVAQHIIHNLNDDGYLDSTVEDIAIATKHDLDDVKEILRMIQNLDPVGCGASGLKECLLIQARNLEQRIPLVEEIIESHLELLYKKDYESIFKLTGISVDKIKEAELIILEFNPKPGRLISSDDTHYVVPDIYVKEEGGVLQAFLNDDGVPRLRVSKLYKDMLKQKNAMAKDYVEDKLRSAMWLIKSIQHRQKTILKVAEAILKYQPLFFKKGPSFLRPMILKDIAMEIGMHESTVSRVTTNKYMYTPIGTFELKYFFNAGVGGKNGGLDVSSEAIKIKIKKLVENERPDKPLSDQKIVELLEKENVQVARRTVAKYREMLNILPTSKRKRK